MGVSYHMGFSLGTRIDLEWWSHIGLTKFDPTVVTARHIRLHSYIRKTDQAGSRFARRGGVATFQRGGLTTTQIGRFSLSASIGPARFASVRHG